MWRCGKVRELARIGDRRHIALEVGLCNIPHPAKVSYGGEDAFFYSSATASLGVADGVGGWHDEGINPADYSRGFLDAVRRYLEGEEVAPAGGDGAAPLAAAAAAAAEALQTGEWIDRALGALDGALWPAATSGSVSSSESTVSDSDRYSSSSTVSSSAAEASDGGGGSAAASLSADDAGANGASLPRAAPPAPQRSLVEALAAAHAATQFPGSTTACVSRLDAEAGELEVANLGDSGLLLFREGRLVFQTPVLQHFWDCPLQFGLPPHTDYAEDADTFRLPLQARGGAGGPAGAACRGARARAQRLALPPGDLVVMGSDGLLDNVFMDQIAEIVAAAQAGRGGEPQATAAALGTLASRQANDTTWESPYTQEALTEGIDIPFWEKLCTATFKDGKLELGKLRGGKLDDITVLVARVEVDE
eukprot:scaffold20.g7762.t1